MGHRIRFFALIRSLVLIVIFVGCPSAGFGDVQENVIQGPCDCIRIRYEFPTARTSFELANPEQLSSSVRIETSTPGATFDGRSFRLSSPATNLDITLKADRASVFGKYPLLTKIAEGKWLLYAPALLGQDNTSIVVSGFAPHRPPIRVRQREGERGYILLGASVRRSSGVSILNGPAVSAPAVELVQKRSRAIIEYYRANLQTGSTARATIVLILSGKRSNSDRPNFRGDATPNGIISLRIRADAADLETSDFSRSFTKFLAHELFHLQQGRIGERPSDAWLHEGAAEYAAWKAVSHLWPDEISVQNNVQRAMNECALYLGNSAISGADQTVLQSVQYNCGPVIQWLVDVELSRPQPRGGFFANWADWNRQTSSGRELPTSERFVRHLEQKLSGRSMVRYLYSTGGPDRWAGLAANLQKFGFNLAVQSPTAFSQRVELLKSVVLSACGAIEGVGEKDGRVFVRGPAQCILFPGEVSVLAIEGVDPMASASEALDRVDAICAVGGSLEVIMIRDNATSTARVTCNSKVTRPAPSLTLTQQ